MTDLGVLRELAEGLLRYDAVTFLQLLDTLRLSEGRAAVWLLHSAAHTVFDYVRSLRIVKRCMWDMVGYVGLSTAISLLLGSSSPPCCPSMKICV